MQVRQWKSLTISANKSTIERSALAQNIENFFIEFDDKFPDKPLTDATQDVLAYLHELQNRKVSFVKAFRKMGAPVGICLRISIDFSC